MLPIQTIFYGPIINPQSLTAYQALPHCLLAVGPNGTIDWMVDDVQEYELQDALAAKGCIDVDIVALRAGEFLMPGFVDTHTHAPQSPNIGSGQQYELLDWLNHVTFPMEAKFADVEFARHTYESVVRRSLDSGTTTCCYYGTLHLEATKILADIVHARGQRAFIGKCNMDRNCPDHYIEPSAESSIADTLSLISHIRTLSGTATASPPTSPPPLVHPILTPRFAISCTPTLLSSLGALAASDPTLHIQTHISENLSEIAFTHTLFPSLPHYAAVYEYFGLLRNNTVLAHAVHLSPAEINMIAGAGAGISHCPTSNFNLSSGVAPVGVYLDAGLKVGLGTDVSGGFSPSILVAVQHASIASKVYAVQHAQRKRDKEAKAAEEVDDDIEIEIPAITPIPTPVPLPPPTSTSTPPKFTNRQLPVPTLLHLATLGGASVCALNHAIGSFAPGKSFDALLVNTRNDAGNPALWSPDHDPALGRERLEGLVERFLFCGDDRNVERVWVAGVCVGGTAWRG